MMEFTKTGRSVSASRPLIGPPTPCLLAAAAAVAKGRRVEDASPAGLKPPACSKPCYFAVLYDLARRRHSGGEGRAGGDL
jgi:hypothetical protein